MKLRLLNYKLFIISSTVLFFSGCKVDRFIWEECDSIIPTGGWQHESDEILVDGEKAIGGIRANPNNRYEFIYYGGSGHPQNGIYKYNLIYNSGELILPIQPSNQIDWSITDWIVFDNNYHIYKCKSNGDSLTQLTFTDRNFWPVWSPDGSQILYKIWDDSGTYWVIMDKDGAFVEKLPLKMGASNLSWSPDGKKILYAQGSNCNLGSDGLFYFDIDSNKSIDITEAIQDICYPVEFFNWYDDSKTILWIGGGHYKSIYKTNIELLQTSVISTGCNSKSYISFALLSDNSTIIAVRVSYKPVSPPDYTKLYKEYDLFQINADGGVFTLPY